MRQLILAVLLTLSASSLAQVSAAEHTFVANVGVDANTASSCKRTNPCRNVAAALTVTDPGGVVTILDSSNYTAFTVTQSVSIVANPGALPLIDPLTGDAITINAPNARVTLRGLYLSSLGTQTQNAIVATSVRTLHIENCVIKGFLSGKGIDFALVPGSSGSELFIKDTAVSNTTTAINILPANISVLGTTTSIEHVQLENNITGVAIGGFVSQVMIRDTIIAGNSSTGIATNASLDGTHNVMVENCTLTGNVKGIQLTGRGATRLTLTNSTIVGSTNFGLEVTTEGAAKAKVRVAHTTFSHNATAIKRNGGQVTSFGNNRQIDNGASDAFSSTLPEV